MSTSVNYMLRPNKAIDRMLFIELLGILSKLIPIVDYKYIGFGSYNFDEFRLLHKYVQINDMESIEANPEIFKRSQYNKPLKCIKLQDYPMSSDEYIRQFVRNKPTIFWLDYTLPQIREQIDEFCSLAGNLLPYDIIKITLNANPSSLGSPTDRSSIHGYRLAALINKISDYLPSRPAETCVMAKEYPKTLLLAINSALNISLGSSKKFFYPLVSNVYADGQQMLTLTGILLDDENLLENIHQTLVTWNYPTTDWMNYNRIEIPHLTLKELITINEHLETGNIQGVLSTLNYKFDDKEAEESINNYVKYYRHYPNYLQVMF